MQRITASSLVEASIATTDIVRATQGDAIKPELPALQMLQAIGILVGAKVETEEVRGPQAAAGMSSSKPTRTAGHGRTYAQPSPSCVCCGVGGPGASGGRGRCHL